MNEKALAQVLKYGMELAKSPPTYYGHNYSGVAGFRPVTCWQCYADFEDDGSASDETLHDENCSWRLFKEGIANLDNLEY